jgi:uncharacterized protein YndB with AHSA1/START domain
MIDVMQQINAVRRTLGSRTLEAGEARSLIISQAYDAPIDDVWDAVTSPDRISRWFLPVSGDLRAGGRFQLEGNAGGTIERCDPPKGFAATWEFGGDTSWVGVRLTSEPGGRTRLELEHTARISEHWQQYGPGAVGVGWDMGFLGLAQHLSPGGVLDRSEGEAWAASPEGKEFMTRSSQGWCEADIAAGTDETTARAAAGRTLAAYTGAAPTDAPG